MNRNIEIKARLRDRHAMESLVEKMCETPAKVLRQNDIFFHSGNGRLKLRVFSPQHGELIYYDRPDQAAAKTSQYLIAETKDPFALRDVLSTALGVAGEVKKVRKLFRIAQTRVHIDAVEGLGDFLELEVVLRPDQDEQEGVSIVRQLSAQLGIKEEDLISGAYVDMMGRLNVVVWCQERLSVAMGREVAQQSVAMRRDSRKTPAHEVGVL
jgi:predicted adenylyl cyclase CyaB